MLFHGKKNWNRRTYLIYFYFAAAKLRSLGQVLSSQDAIRLIFFSETFSPVKLK